jgi:integrase
MTKRRKKGEGHIYLRGQAYWIKFYANGKPVFESSGSKKLEFAHRLLRKRLGEVDDGLFGAGKGGRVRVAELLDDLEASYAKRGRSYTDFCEPIVRTQLRPYWASLRVTEVTTKRLLDYRSKRLHEKKAVATVNRELALLRRAFNLGRQATPPKVLLVPHFPLLPENNVRTGFLEHAKYQALLVELPKELRPLLVVGYHTGCRVGELLSLKWHQVDLLVNRIRLEPGTTKNKEGRVIPIFWDMGPVLRHQLEERDQWWPTCRWVFFRGGKRIRDFRDSWDSACDRAKLPGLHFHDLRRSAVRNMVRAGIPEKVAMAISGHKTRAIFDRYNIVNDRDLTDAAQRMDSYLAQQTVTKTVTAADREKTQCEAEGVRKLLN